MQIKDYWFVVGNEEYAFAINMRDQSEIHYFDRDPDVNNDAFIRAVGWCYPGIGAPSPPIIPTINFFKNYLDMLGIDSKMPTYKYPCEDPDKDFIEDPETKDFFRSFLSDYFKSLGISSNEDVAEKV